MIGMAGEIFERLCAMNKAKAEELAHESDQDWASTPNDEIAPHIAKIPLRAEVRDMLRCADLYEHSARMHDEESERLRELAKQARAQAVNLTKVADL